MNVAAPALVLVTTSFPLKHDGSEAAGSFVADLAMELARAVPVRVVAPGPFRDRGSFASGVEVFRFAAPDKPLSTLSMKRPGDVLAMLRVLAAGRQAALDAVQAGPTMHQLALWALPSGDWARHAYRATGVPYAVWTLGSDIWSLSRIPVVREYLRGVIRGATVVFSDGLALADATSRLVGRPVEFLPSARRLGRRQAPVRSVPPYRLLFLGRWHPNKGVDLLLDALEQLDTADWARVEVVRICGGGPMDSVVRARSQRLAQMGWPVTCEGFLDRGAARSALTASDYVLIPSRLESIPVVFSDAMQQGCPVVAMPVGDLPRLVVDGGVGFCADSVSPAAFAAALRRALASVPAQLAPRVSAMADNFSVDAAASRLLGTLRQQGSVL